MAREQIDTRKARRKITGNFCRQQNELFDVFHQIVGPRAVSVYTHLTRMAFGDDATVEFSVRELAKQMGRSHTPVARDVRVLEYLKMVRITNRGGNRESECELLDLFERAAQFGAKYNTRTRTTQLPQDVTEDLKAQVAALRKSLQGKNPGQGTPIGEPPRDMMSGQADSERYASVSPERQQRYARDTQSGPPL